MMMMVSGGSLVPPQFEQFMPFSRFKDFCHILPEIHVDESIKETNPWYQFSDAVDKFNFI
jgi:hypothetical protein